jgi:hypothetical protein
MSNSALRFLRSTDFWTWAIVALLVAGTFFVWELRLVPLPIPELPRAPATTLELAYTGVLTLLLALAAGLFGWQRKNGSCPIGVKRTVGIAGALGGLALLCPVCLALPGLLLGVGTLIAILGQFLPLIRLLAIVFALVAVWLLWPKRA